MTKNNKFDINVVKELYTILHKSYPIIDRDNIKLFSIGFSKELKISSGLSIRTLKHFFNWYCGINYRKLIKEGENRYNLKGEIAGTVNKKEAEHAKKFIMSKNKKSDNVVNKDVINKDIETINE